MWSWLLREKYTYLRDRPETKWYPLIGASPQDCCTQFSIQGSVLEKANVPPLSRHSRIWQIVRETERVILPKEIELYNYNIILLYPLKHVYRYVGTNLERMHKCTKLYNHNSICFFFLISGNHDFGELNVSDGLGNLVDCPVTTEEGQALVQVMQWRVDIINQCYCRGPCPLVRWTMHCFLWVRWFVSCKRGLSCVACRANPYTTTHGSTAVVIIAR
jgi:hypothetical protein